MAAWCSKRQTLPALIVGTTAACLIQSTISASEKRLSGKLSSLGFSQAMALIWAISGALNCDGRPERGRSDNRSGTADCAWRPSMLAALNLFVGFCVGCFVYYQLNRLGVPGFLHSPLRRR